MPKESESGRGQKKDEDQFPDDVIATEVGQPQHEEPGEEQSMLVMLAPEIPQGDTLFVRLAEKRNKVPLVPERDIDVILDDVENQDDKGEEAKNQDGQPDKPP
jgi:hypothetical protein